jgi:hypothetical protein
MPASVKTITPQNRYHFSTSRASRLYVHKVDLASHCTSLHVTDGVHLVNEQSQTR